jgi:hypothetical protein
VKRKAVAANNDDSRLCHRCVGENGLKSKIKQMGRMANCSFCKKTAKTIDIYQATEIFDTVLVANFERTNDEPSSMEYMMRRESDFEWERSGEDILDVLQDVGKIEPEIAERIRILLHDKHYDFEMDKMGFEQEFAPDSRYRSKDVDSDEFHSQWRSFEKSLKTKARYFSRRTTSTLLDLFNGIHRSTTSADRSVILQAGPGTAIISLFRARLFQDEDKLTHALERPDQEIGPPPAAQAAAGRMNARGISVFFRGNRSRNCASRS